MLPGEDTPYPQRVNPIQDVWDQDQVYLPQCDQPAPSMENGTVPYINSQMSGGMGSAYHNPYADAMMPYPPRGNNQEDDENRDLQGLDIGRVPMANPPLRLRYPTNDNFAPSYVGMIKNTGDALLLLFAAYEGFIPYIPKRPNEEQQRKLIKPLYVMIYEQEASGVKRWTDPMHWSPSRIIHDNFLVYRELTEPKGTAKKKALKSDRPRRGGVRYAPYEGAGHGRAAAAQPHEQDRDLVGALVDSYDFKPGGLIKKTLSVRIGGKPHHLVAYYDLEHGRKAWDDATASPTGMQLYDPQCPFKHVRPNPDLITFTDLRNKHERYELLFCALPVLDQPQQEQQQPQQQPQQLLQQPRLQPGYGIQAPYPQQLPTNGYSQVPSYNMDLPVQEQGMLYSMSTPQPVGPMLQQPMQQAGMPMSGFGTPQGFVQGGGQPQYTPEYEPHLRK